MAANVYNVFTSLKLSLGSPHSYHKRSSYHFEIIIKATGTCKGLKCTSCLQGFSEFVWWFKNPCPISAFFWVVGIDFFFLILCESDVHAIEFYAIEYCGIKA